MRRSDLGKCETGSYLGVDDSHVQPLAVPILLSNVRIIGKWAGKGEYMVEMERKWSGWIADPGHGWEK